LATDARKELNKLSEQQIVIGKMSHTNIIKTGSEAQSIGDWNGRAAWSFLRLQFGRSIDAEIKEHFRQLELKQKRRLRKAERWVEFMKYFEHKTAVIPKPRKIQFIMEGSAVIAVASLHHLLLPPNEVYEMGDRIIQQDFPCLKAYTIGGLKGETYLLQEQAGFEVGLQLYGGSIDTREAITVSSWLRVETCLNPLSWLGIGWFGSFTGRGSRDFERILRIKVKDELKHRLKASIEEALEKTKVLDERVKLSKGVNVKRSDAEIILSALGLSYTLGTKTVEQILDRLDKEQKTQWGMSMASSWVAAHGKFKETPKGQERSVEQKLSTIAGATLLIDDTKDAKEKSVEWLKAHVNQGQVGSLGDLMQRLGIDLKKKVAERNEDNGFEVSKSDRFL
jgi:hypothetical protein